jgi:predicted phosphatase
MTHSLDWDIDQAQVLGLNVFHIIIIYAYISKFKILLKFIERERERERGKEIKILKI